MIVPVYRFAPSPNGRLHLGHAYSAYLNAELAKRSGGRFLVRIEDTDRIRCKPEFVDAALKDLEWLGLTWENPVRIQSEHLGDYDAVLEKLWGMGAIYPCFCSRTDSAAHALASQDPDGQAHYGGTRRSLSRKDAVSRIAAGMVHGWRIDMTAARDADAAVWGDVVVAKKTVGSSYHVAVVTDDALQSITHVVRGRDMEPATPIHLLLQKLLGLPSPHYQHHDLICDDLGRKLSKSDGSESLASLGAAGLSAADVRRKLGFD